MTPDEVKRLADDYAHCYSFVGDDTMPRRKAELYAAIDAIAAQAVPAQPVAWRIRETNPEYPEPCPWHYREQSERPYCSWKYHEMQPLYASPQAAQPDTQEKPLTDEEMADCGLLSELEDTQPSSHAEPAKSKE